MPRAWFGPGRLFGDEQAPVGNRFLKRFVLRRINNINAACDHRNRSAFD
jgi:hypothetical protein